MRFLGTLLTMTKALEYHVPVLLEESIDALITNTDGVYIDATFGGGGHSKRILQRITAKGRLFGFDQDGAVFNNLIDDKRFEFVHSNFEYLCHFMEFHGIDHADGILADLGVSSNHLDDLKRGFSIKSQSDLDMRMNTSDDKTAQDVLNRYNENDLIQIFSEYGEVRNSKTLAKAIINRREQREFQTVNGFMEFLGKYVMGDWHRYHVQVFQAIRIELNREIDVLKSLLINASKILRPGGRLVVLSYHSIEDRVVKNFIKAGNFKGRVEKDDYGNALRPLKEVKPKLLTPSKEEIKLNSRAASAKMRVAEKI